MCYFCLLFHTSDLIFQKQCSLSMWTRPENTCLVLIKKSERCRSYISTDYQGAEIELTLMHIHAHKHWRWDAGSEICYSPCLFWRCFSAGESGMLVVPVWKTTAIKRAFCCRWKCSTVFCRQQQHLFLRRVLEYECRIMVLGLRWNKGWTRPLPGQALSNMQVPCGATLPPASFWQN